MRIVGLDLGKQFVDSSFYFQRAVNTGALVGRRVEFNNVVLPLVVNLAEDKLEQFPKRLRLLQTLIAGDVIVAAAKGEEKRVGCGGF